MKRQKGLVMNDILRKAICPGTQSYIRDQWYVIAFSNEVQIGRPFVRKCMDEPVLLFRDSSGQVAALYDRCPHRGVPLSQGRVVSDRIECAYHGFQFDRTGRCVLIPTQEIIPKAAYTRSYSGPGPTTSRDFQSVAFGQRNSQTSIGEKRCASCHSSRRDQPRIYSRRIYPSA
jgi:nitrite reductase/ring-hydroxylating ferredoxin subunit